MTQPYSPTAVPASAAQSAARVHLVPGEAAARLDRLPLAGVHWRLAMITQVTYGLVISLDASASRLYPIIWEPAKAITPLQYTVLFMVQVGIGLLLGEWIFGFLSDRFGRKRVLLIAIVIAAVGFFLIAFSSDFVYQLIVSGISSMGIGGMLAINVVYMQEIAPPKIRSRVSQASQGVGLLITGVGIGFIGAALLPANWQTWIFLLAALVIVVDVPLIAFGMPESPRWLEGKGKEQQALKALAHIEKAASRNGRRQLPEPRIDEHLVGETEKVPLRELFTKRFMPRNILLLVCWMLIYAGAVYGFGQYSVAYMVGKGFPVSAIFITLGVGTGVGGLVALLILSAIGERMERKTAILIGGVLFAVSLVVIGVAPNVWVVGGAIVVAHLSVVVMFTNMYIYTANAYPTRLRSLGTGLTDGLGHSGAIWGPFVATATFSIAGLAGWGWLLWCAIPGALLPGILIAVFGRKQSGVSLEDLTEKTGAIAAAKLSDE